MYVKEYERELMEVGAYRLHKQLYVYVSPIIVVVGIVGNSLSFVVLVQRPMRRVSTYCYLIALAVADTVVLTAGLLPTWLEQTWGVDVKALTQWTCKVRTWTLYTVSDYTVWLIIAVTVERYVVVCHALSARVVCRRRRAIAVIVLLFVVFLGLNLHFFWTVGLSYDQVDNHNVTHCAGADGYETLVAEIWPWVDAGVYSFIPLFVIATFNSFIVRHVVSARRMRRQLASFRLISAAPHERPRVADGVSRSAAAAAVAALGAPARQRAADRRRRSTSLSCGRNEAGQNARMIVLLLAVSFTFVAATLPRCCTLIVTEFIHRSLPTWAASADDPQLYLAKVYGSVRLAMAATDLLMYANHAVNFFLYCATGQKFRQQLCAVVLVVVRCRRLGLTTSVISGGTMNIESAARRRQVRRCDDSASLRSFDKENCL